MLDAWPVVRRRSGRAISSDSEGAAQSDASRRLEPRIEHADRVARSICPNCAVGCAQLAYVKDGEVIQVEGDPASLISPWTAVPKGAATRSLHAGPLREYKVKYRPAYGTRILLTGEPRP